MPIAVCLCGCVCVCVIADVRSEEEVAVFV